MRLVKRLILLTAGVVVLATVGAALSDTATGSRPLGHVVGGFTAERMGFAAPGGPLVRLGTATVEVNIFDRTLDVVCPGCPGPDEGSVTETLEGGNTRTYQVANVIIDGGTALVFTEATAGIYLFHDGGVPGKEIVGPPNSVGLVPTRDWYEQRFFTGTQRITGYVTSGNIMISSPTN
jgi:hypothetical protein